MHIFMLHHLKIWMEGKIYKKFWAEIFLLWMQLSVEESVIDRSTL